MCFEIDSLPPHPPVSGGAADTEEVVLTADDGTQFAAFRARPETPSSTGVVVLPDVRGLFRFYEELAIRLAEVGMNAIAIDYFGRTAGVGRRGADFEWQAHVGQTTQANVKRDVAAAVEHLRSPEGGASTSLFTLGFCFGGSNSWNQAAEGHGLSGAIGFYGRPGPGLVDGAPGPLTRVDKMACPILALAAGNDAYIDAAEVVEFRDALNAAGVKNDIITYPGTPHSFFDQTYDQYKDECDDAWKRILAFIDTYK